MRRLLFVMFCLIVIVPAFAVDDDTLNVYINITESSAIAFTDGKYTLDKGDLSSFEGLRYFMHRIIVAVSESEYKKASNGRYESVFTMTVSEK